MSFRWVVAVIVLGCAPSITYTYETDLQVVMVDDERDEDTRLVSLEKEPISPVKYDHWLIPSSWAVKLGTLWADLPYVFDATGPEYCTAFGVDRKLMLHASLPVRYRDNNKARRRCPNLVWKDDTFMIGIGAGHSHQSPAAHGERISAKDATLGSLLLARVAGKAQIAPLRVAAPVPAQSLLFTRFNGAVHVFLWTPEATSAAGKRDFVRVYKPAPGAAWEEVGSCWVDERKLERAQLTGSIPPVDCSSPDFWLK